MAVFHLEDLFDALDLAGEDAIECGAVAWPKLSCILNTGEAEHMGFQQPLSIAILERWAYRGGAAAALPLTRGNRGGGARSAHNDC